jgi:hypothetical protein
MAGSAIALSARRARPFVFMAETAIDDWLGAAIGRHGRGQVLSTALIHRPGMIC